MADMKRIDMKYVIDQDVIIQDYCMECMLLAGGVNPRQRNDCVECYSSLRMGMEQVDITQKYKRYKGY